MGRRGLFDALVRQHLHQPRFLKELRSQRLLLDFERGDKESELELAKSGYAPAQFTLGRELLERDQRDEGFRWLKKASDGKFLPATYFMALAYERLDDPKRAQPLFAKLRRETANAERRRDTSALFVLANMYYEGVGGLEKDAPEARRLACLVQASAQASPRYPRVTLEEAEMSQHCRER